MSSSLLGRLGLSLHSRRRRASRRAKRRVVGRLFAEQLEQRKVLAAGTIEFATATTLVNEQAGYRTIEVLRVGGSDGSLSVNYATSDGTATVADGDYVATSGALVFAAGETKKAITVQVANAGTDVANENFLLTLSGPPAALGTQVTNTITINDTPTVGTIAAQTTPMGTPTSAISFTVGDAETAAGDLSVTAFSTNPTLLPPSGIVLGGSGTNRTITLTPVAGLSGTAQVTILVTDAGGASVVRQFNLSAGAATAGTAIAVPATIPNVVLTADDSFTLNYTITNAAWVTSVTRTNTILFNNPATSSTSDLRTQPTSGGTARTLRIRPSDNSTAAGDYGTDTVTLGFTGSGAPAAQAFNVRVNPRAVADNNLLAIPGTTSTFDVLANDVTPLAGHTFNITSVSTPDSGTLSITPDGKYVRYTPTNPNAHFDTFTYTVTVSSSDVFNGFTFTGIGYVKIGGYVVVDSATQSQHIDLDFDYINGEWVQNIRTQPSIVGSVQSGNFSDTILDSDEGVLFFDPSTKKTLTAGAELDTLAPVLGVSAGDSVWVGPSNSTIGSNKLYLGIANESTSADIDSYVPAEYSWASAAQYVRTDLVGFSGPGHFAATDGQFYFDTLDGLNSANEAAVGDNPADSFFGFRGSHAHLNWYFTAPGKYELTFRTSVRVGGVFVYSPDSTFTFYVDSMAGDVRLRENPPLARPDAATVNEDSSATVVNVLANDSSMADPYEVLAVTSVTQGNNGGTVAIGIDGANVVYTPAANFFGTETFTYTVTDEHGGAATGTVTVTVLGVLDAPIGIDVQNGQSQRSFVRHVDLNFGPGELLSPLLDAGRIQVTKFNLNGESPFPFSAFAASIDGGEIKLDFGAQGIGGNRNTSAGDGYYRIGVDIDGDSVPDAFYYFFRLLGDVNGDGQVTVLDRNLILANAGSTNPEFDVNGDGIVTSVDLTLVTRAVGKKLKNGLWVDD